jgi:hypothetical protein
MKFSRYMIARHCAAYGRSHAITRCATSFDKERDMTSRMGLAALLFTAGASLAPPVLASTFFFTAGDADGQLGALSGDGPQSVATETADDFFLPATTVISGATITGLIDAPVTNIGDVEVEVYHVFPLDSKDPPSGSVFTRVNSPADVEIASATRDSSAGTLTYSVASLNGRFAVSNSVVNGIHAFPGSKTGGEGPASGEEIQVTLTFTHPIVLPAGHYFFRPQVALTGGRFLFLSAPRPMVSPTPITPDLQAWIRNANLAPDWLRIGGDIVVGAPPTFNMAFSLRGNTIPEAGIPGEETCHGDSVSAVARQFRGVAFGASALGFASVAALQDALDEFCNPQ